MVTPWRRREDKDGFPFYINEETKVQQWNHPKFADIQQRLDDCNYVKYSMYRVALKFRVLQNALYMEEVPLSVIVGVFEKHKLGVNEGSLCLECCDLEAILSDIYFASNKKNHTNVDIDFATELMLNFLYDVYDKNRKGLIQVSSTKVTLYLLSNCTLHDLYRCMFNVYSDHNNCITRLRLQSLLTRISEIMVFLHEDNSYGPSLVNAAVEHCFRNSPGLVGISESTFVCWLEERHKLISWISLLHRIKKAEPVIHTIRCTTCKTNPLMGLRYKCTKCIRYTQCQRCFFTGRTSRSHKLTHSMREYATEADGKCTFVKRICRLLQCSQPDEDVVIETKPLCDQSKELSCNIEPLSSPQTQLQLVIRQLELQNKELQQLIHLRNKNDKDVRQCLEDHHLHIAAQIQKLKVLKEYFHASMDTVRVRDKRRKHISESTPMVQDCGKKPRTVEMEVEMFSPIVPQVRDGSITSTQMVSDRRSDDNIDETGSSRYCMENTTWIGDHATTSIVFPRKSPVREFHNDLDEALAKLQQILANNFTLDESLGHVDNTNLQYAVSEVEGMLTSIIDSVESSRGGSVRSRGGTTKGNS